MKPWMVLTTLAVLLVLAGIWLVWSQSPDVETSTEFEEEIAAAEAVPVSKISLEPEHALDQTEVLRVLEEMAKNQQALDDWDQQLAQACKSLIKSKKYEEAYVIKSTSPETALKKLNQAVRLLKFLPKEYQAYMEKAERLKKRIESGPEEPRYQRPRPEDF